MQLTKAEIHVVLTKLSTPMLTVLLGSDRFFLELDEADQLLIDVVKEELARRNWPACMSDAELKEAEMAVPMGESVIMVAQEMDRRGLSTDVALTPEQYDALEAGAKFCEQHGLIFDCEEICPECHHQELLAENPELAAGEEVWRQAVIREQKMFVPRGRRS